MWSYTSSFFVNGVDDGRGSGNDKVKRLLAEMRDKRRRDTRCWTTEMCSAACIRRGGPAESMVVNVE